MAPFSRRMLTVSGFAAAYFLGALAGPASAGDRKFVVFLADPAKDHPGGSLDLPKRTDIWDAYFDKNKNGQGGSRRVDSHAEWWEEVSYGDVTVAGEVFGWYSVPWPTSPPGFDGGRGSIIPHVDLQGGDSYQPRSGEGFSRFVAKFRYDIDGAGESRRFNDPPQNWPGFGGADNFNGRRIWTPGERFVDLNDNDVYDAGVREWGIDKNHNGKIDEDLEATSLAQLFGVIIQYPDDNDPPGTPPLLIDGWTNATVEWFDSNGDGKWNLDDRERLSRTESFPLVGGGFMPVEFYSGDWGGLELWFDGDADLEVGERATQDERVRGEGNANENEPPTIWEFLVQINDPEDDSVEYFDEQWNEVYDFPEPFEDFMRRWSPFAHDFIRTSDEYIRANYPGDAQRLIDRSGNARYNSPDSWSNNGQVTSTNKMQQVIGILLDEGEAAEQNNRRILTGTTVWDEDEQRILSRGTPPWLETFWQERYGTAPPTWILGPIPYLRKFDPGTPIPQLRKQDEQPRMKFEPDRGGIFHDGRQSDRSYYPGDEGTVRPRTGHRNEGWYDGLQEYDDLASSIYHAAGDQNLGEITSPANNAPYGNDEGANTPKSTGPDGMVEAGGPLAYNVHGDGGFDGGNVLTLEYMTWRTDGQNSADTDDAQGIRTYHRDTNLDGLMDLGETPGDAGDYGLPDTVYANYGVDPYPGTAADGNPNSFYPWSRLRLVEDSVAALDNATDWDEFLGGEDFGNVISGLILLPGETAEGMFFLPAASLNYGILVRDGRKHNEVIRRGAYVPRIFFNGLGISLDSAGEGDQFVGGGFHTAFAAHEYGHTWEGYPDLYDYDVWREFGGAIINTPIGRWCVMAGGGLVHPVGILKHLKSKWIEPVDITNVLNALGRTTIEFRTWEFNRRRTLFKYTNPTFTGESFYIWRESGFATDPDTGIGDETFDKFMPGRGLLIMHVDDRGNKDGLPPQQRLNGHFTYLIIQADGRHDLEQDNGPNSGDAGDPWPGSSGATRWNRFTDPSNKWYTDEGSGLDIVNIVESGESTFVTFDWTPRELPFFSWVQPPGGTSVNGLYNLRYFAYDQNGGTTIEFYVDSDTQGFDGAFVGSTGKPLGDIDGAFKVSIAGLPNGTYSFYAKLDTGDVNGPENRRSLPRPNIDNKGNGTMTVNNGDVDLAVSLLEVWTAKVVDDSVRNKEIWLVTGNRSGVQAGRAVTGRLYQADDKLVNGIRHVPVRFAINPGSKRFRTNDRFSFVTTGLTEYSDAVLIFEGEVVKPQPPKAVIAEIEPATGLSGWTTFRMTSASSDPGDADFTEVWNFGDGSRSPVQSVVPSSVTHQYSVAGDHVVSLVVTNSFGLKAVAQALVRVTDPLPPLARSAVSADQGRMPLKVTFDGSASIDQNDPSLGGSSLTWTWTLADGTVLDPINGAPNTADIQVGLGPDSGPFDVTFNRPGVYRVTMMVENGFGRSASTVQEVRVVGPPSDRPPVALMDASRRSGVGPLVVVFDGGRSFDPEQTLLEFAWNFDDGSAIVRGVSTIEHTFNRARTYNVMLTVSDGSNQTDDYTLAIVVTADAATVNGSPVARISASGNQGAAPFTVDFDASASTDPEGGPLAYLWDFGDGSPQSDQAIVSHTFTEPRNYTVVLGVTDAGGASGSTTFMVSVTLPSGADAAQDAPDDGASDSAQPFGCGGFSLFPMMMLTLLGVVTLRRQYGVRRVP